MLRAILAVIPLLAALPATAGWLPEERLTARTNAGDYTTDNNGRAIAADPAGNLHVVWHGRDGVRNQVWYSRRDAGTGDWSVPTTISSLPDSAVWPSVAVDDSGNAHVVWQVGASDDGKGIRYRWRNAGTGEWGAVESVADGIHCEHPSVACRTSGLVVAAWHEQSPGIWKNAFCARRAAGDWLPAERVSGDFDGQQTSVGVGVDSSGGLGVLWQASHSGLTYILYRERRQTGWAEADTVSEGSSCATPTLWVEVDGDAHAVWKVSGAVPLGYRLLYRRRSAGVWSDTSWVPRPFNREQLQPTLCVSDETGQPHLAWFSDTSNIGVHLYHSVADPTGQSWSQPLRLTSGLPSKSSPGLSVGPGSNVQVVWTDWRHSSQNPDVYCRRTGIIRDVATTAILAPGVAVDSGEAFVPKAVFRNLGEAVEDFAVWARVDTLVSMRMVTALAPGEEDTVEFDTFRVFNRGSRAVCCSAWVRDDTCRGNDFLRNLLFVRVLDVAAESIVAPRGRIRPEPFVPSVRVRNHGNCLADCRARMVFRDSVGATVYDEVASESLEAGESRLLSFGEVTLPQGRYSARCSLVVGDMHPDNDTASAEFMVYEPDIVIGGLIWPPAQVDSGASGRPLVMVENRGVLATDFWAWLAIGSGYSDSVFVEELGAGVGRAFTFAEWTPRQRGWSQISCSLLVVPESTIVGPLRESTFVRVVDAAVERIVEPVGLMSADTVRPVALVANPGNVAAVGFCLMVFRDDSARVVYADSVGVELAAGQADTVRFRGWPATPGRYLARCSVAVSDDRQSSNDAVEESFEVFEPDVGVTAILWPPAVVDSGTVGNPAAAVRNFGPGRAVFSCRLAIGSHYADTAFDVSLEGGGADTIRFRDWPALRRGEHEVRCSVFGLDRRADCARPYTVFVRVTDAAVAGILSPPDTTRAGPLVPQVSLANPGNVEVEAACRFRIGLGTSELFRDSVVAALAAGGDTVIVFRQWQAPPGYYWCEAVVRAPGDIVPANDTALRAFTVESLPVEPWTRLADVPEGPRRAPVRDGGRLAGCGEQVLALKGCNTVEWYRYAPATGEWARLADVPRGASGRRVKTGAALASDGAASAYLVKGRGTREFYRYDLPADAWESLPALPEATAPVRNGAALCHVAGDTNRLFLLKASGTSELLVHWLEPGEWHAQRPLPAGPRGRPARHGSGLAALGGRVFALKGGTNEFYEFFPARDSWAARAEVPLRGVSGRTRRCRRGAALATDGERFCYLFKGAGCGETWVYDAAGDSWFQAEDIPRGERGRRVGKGAALAWCGDRLYALKGGGCRELWSHFASDEVRLTNGEPPIRGVASGTFDNRQSGFSIEARPLSGGFVTLRLALPGTGAVRVSVLDASGRRVMSRSVEASQTREVSLDVRSLSAGIYLVRLDCGGRILTGKLVLQ